MENINEELNYMKYLFGYKTGVVISEQSTQQPAQPEKVGANIEIPKMNLNTSREFKTLFVTNEYDFKTPVVLLKYTDNSAIIVGSLNNKSILFVGTLPSNYNPSNQTEMVSLMVSKPMDQFPTNEFQWVKYINNYDNGNIPASTIANFLSMIKTRVPNSFGTLTPDKLGPAVNNDPNRLKKYQEAIAMSGINPNFKKG